MHRTRLDNVPYDLQDTQLVRSMLEEDKGTQKT